MLERNRLIPTIIGPTASGKSGVALSLAVHIPDVEIVSADSRQIYSGLAIGTAQPTPEERAAVPHHLVDFLPITERYSAGRFSRDAGQVIEEIIRRGKRPLLVGGSGFYLRALFDGLSAPPMQEETRQVLVAELETRGRATLHSELSRVDPEAACLIPPGNPEKLIRALACFRETGQPYSSFTTRSSGSTIRPSYLLLDPPRELLWERIEARARRMVAQGLVEETLEALQREGVSSESPGLRTVGYREVIEYLEQGGSNADELIREIFIATRRYSKRQRTWFRHQVDHPRIIAGPSEEGAALDWMESTLRRGV